MRNNEVCTTIWVTKNNFLLKHIILNSSSHWINLKRQCLQGFICVRRNVCFALKDWIPREIHVIINQWFVHLLNFATWLDKSGMERDKFT